MTDPELALALREAAYLEGEFTLRSGRKSRYYFDKYLFETNPDLLRELGQRLGCFVDDHITRIAGAELGGVALAAATALSANRPFVIVRNSKKAGYGTGKQIEGQLEPGDGVLLVEDVVTSGGQALEAARTLQAAGATVAQIIAVIDRLEGAREAIEAEDIPFQSLFTIHDLGIERPPTSGGG